MEKQLYEYLLLKTFQSEILVVTSKVRNGASVLLISSSLIVTLIPACSDPEYFLKADWLFFSVKLVTCQSPHKMCILSPFESKSQKIVSEDDGHAVQLRYSVCGHSQILYPNTTPESQSELDDILDRTVAGKMSGGQGSKQTFFFQFHTKKEGG